MSSWQFVLDFIQVLYCCTYITEIVKINNSHKIHRREQLQRAPYNYSIEKINICRIPLSVGKTTFVKFLRCFRSSLLNCIEDKSSDIKIILDLLFDFVLVDLHHDHVCDEVEEHGGEKTIFFMFQPFLFTLT